MKEKLLKELLRDLHKLRLVAVITATLAAMDCGDSPNPIAPDRTAHHGICTQREIIYRVNSCGQ